MHRLMCGLCLSFAHVKTTSVSRTVSGETCDRAPPWRWGSPPPQGSSLLPELCCLEPSSLNRPHPPHPRCMGFLLSSDFRVAISLSCFLDQFLCSTWNSVSSSRPAVLQSRRAQELSRLAVAPTLRRAPPSPGHTLTAPSTMAPLGTVGMTIRGEPAVGHGSIAPQPCIRWVQRPEP